MKRLISSTLIMILLVCGIVPVLAQQPPRAQTQTAVLNALSQRVGVPGLGLGSLVSWNWFFGTYDFVVSQGCVGAPASAPGGGATGWQRYILNYKGTEFVYLVSDDAANIVLCNEAVLNALLTPVPSATTAPAQPATSTPPPLAMMTSTPAANVVNTPIIPTNVADACPLTPHLTSGMGRVLPGDPNWLHEQPARASRKISEIPAGEMFTIYQGPVCDPASHMNYWQINYGNQTGWTSEGLNNVYWLEMVGLNMSFLTSNAAKAAPAEWLSTFPKGIRDIAVSANGGTMAVLDVTGAVTLYDGTTLVFKSQMPDPDPAVRIALSADGQLLAAAQPDSGVVVWDIAANTVSGPVIHTGAITAMAFSPVFDTEVVLAVATDEGKIWLWRTPGLTPQDKPLTIIPSGGTAITLEFNSIGTMLIARDSAAGVLGVWQVKP